MKATDKLKYPDFTVPGSVVLLIGGMIAGSQFFVEHTSHGWLLAGTLSGTGVLILARRKLGTVFFAAGIAYGLYWRVFVEGLGDVAALKLTLKAIILIGLLDCLVGQVKYFSARGKSGKAPNNQKA